MHHIKQRSMGKSNQNAINIDTKKRTWVSIGHTLQKPSDGSTQTLEWNPQGKRKVERPRQIWRRTIEAEANDAGFTCV
jgi:hypothetical protein